MDDVRPEGLWVSQEQLRTILAEFAVDVHERVNQAEHRVFNLSQALAESEYGVEAVRAAIAAAGDKLKSFAGEHHPYGALMQWFKEAGSH